jgi:lipid-binding SYLF domain-containing protein
MKTTFVLALAAVLALPGCASESVSVPDQRDSIMKMRDQTLAELYKAKPETKEKIAKAPGYAVFSTYGLTVIFVGGAGGKGVAVNNQTKKETFMEEGSASVGLGIGGTEVRTVFVFNDAQALDEFINKGWEFGAQGQLQAQSGEKGGTTSDAMSFSKSTEIYQLGKNGLMAQATVAGTKFWKDKELN